MKIKMLMATICIAAMGSAIAVSAAAPTASVTNGEFQQAFDAVSQKTMLSVTPDDTITLDISGATGSVTILSARVNTEIASETIQYVDQVEKGTDSISFKVRELSGQDGVYSLQVNNGTETSSLYYKVGRPNLTEGVDGVEYVKKVHFANGDVNDGYKGTTSLAFEAKYAINSPVDAIEQYGFEITGKIRGNDGALSADPITKSTYKALEGDLTGLGEFVFATTVYNIPDYNNAADVEVIDSFSVKPVIIYNTDSTSVTE